MTKKLIFLISAVFVFTSFSASAASSVIFFSDLTSGPNTGGQDNKGVFVTIWGKNFGATRGSSYVSIGGGQADNYPVWSDTKITFQLGANATTGNIAVTTSEGTSNGVSFTVRSGNIYFVKTTGSDTAGNGSWDDPWRTIIKAKNTIAAGDIVYICDGVSQTTEDSTETYGAFVNLGSSGTSTNPKALVAYPGATVNIGNDSLNRGIHKYIPGGGNAAYWVLSQLRVRSSGTVFPGGDGFRIVGNDITAPNGDGQTAGIEASGNSMRILGNELHNVGAAQPTKKYHNIYIDNRSGVISDIEIGWNIIRNSTANRAIQVYDENGYISNVNIHDNLIHDVRGNGININLHSTGIFNVYNNIIYNAGLGPDFTDGSTVYTGIYIAGNNATIYLYNNLIYNCGYSGGSSDATGLMLIGTSFTGTVYPRNNIFYSNGAAYEPYQATGGRSPSNGAYKNLFHGKGATPSWDTASINQDPLFVNLASYDFHLQATSPAKDAGYDTTAIVTRDYDGVLRPQGSGFDIGSFEYVSQTFHLADTNQNGKVEMRELMAFVAKWKTNQAILSDVLDIMGRWLKGE